MQARPVRIVMPSWFAPLLIVVALLWAMAHLRNVFSPLFFAFLIAYLFDPLADKLEAKGLPRGAAIGVILALSAIVLLLVILIGIPIIGRELAYFASTVPDKIIAVWKDFEPWLAEHGIVLPSSFSEALASLDFDAEAAAKQFAAPLKGVLAWLLGGAANALGALFGAVMTPVIAFYFLYDFDRAVAAIRSFIPERRRDIITGFFREVDDALSQFVRGQVMVMTILTVLFVIGYAVIGVPMALVIGVVAGLLSFIPYVGGAVALSLALLMSALHWSGWGQLLGVVVVYTIIQLLEGFVITPKIMGDKVGLSSVWVIIALLAGGEMFGFLGVLLAVPVAAVLKITLVRLAAKYRKSKFFLEGSGDTSEPDILPRGLATDP